MLSTNWRATLSMWSYRIFVTIFTNWITELVAPIDSLVMRNSPRKVIKTVKFCDQIARSIWLYSEKKSIKEAIAQPAKSFENFSTKRGRLASCIVTLFISKTTLMSRYVIFFSFSPQTSCFYRGHGKVWEFHIWGVLIAFLWPCWWELLEWQIHMFARLCVILYKSSTAA